MLFVVFGSIRVFFLLFLLMMIGGVKSGLSMYLLVIFLVFLKSLGVKLMRFDLVIFCCLNGGGFVG